MFKIPCCVITASFLLSAVHSSCDAKSLTLSVDVDGRQLVGTPLTWSDRQVHLLGRDGRLWSFSPNKVSSFKKTSSIFRAYSHGELRGQLIQEFGRNYDVSGTGHYLVVHPTGQRDKWAQRFENLYRSMVHYFNSRGFSVDEPDFPLVAVVFARQRDFVRYAHQRGVRGAGNFLGYYDGTSNRILMYDTTHGQSDDSNWFINAETIIHEAAHQTAFNTGLHNRYSAPPRWLSEGIGTMFEAKGVWNSRHFPHRRDRVNLYQLQTFRRKFRNGKTGYLSQLIADERHFSRDVTASYAMSWAATFFLSEQEPRKLVRYMKKTAERPEFTQYTAPERLNEFTTVFGSNLNMLETRLHRFVASLP